MSVDILKNFNLYIFNAIMRCVMKNNNENNGQFNVEKYQQYNLDAQFGSSQQFDTDQQFVTDTQVNDVHKITSNHHQNQKSYTDVQLNQAQHISPESNKKKKKGLLFWASLVVMIAALIALGVIAAGYLEGCMMYKDVSEEVFHDSDSMNLNDMKIDWDKLLAINPETVGWIYIPGTVVNYPVVHTTDNDKYLKTSFRGYQSYVSFGTIFVDCNNKHDLSDENIVTYGHHMNDGSMYALFYEMRNSDVFNQNRNIYFLTPNGNYRLKSFTLVYANAQEKIIQTNFGSETNRVNYINDKINRCCVDVVGQIPDVKAMSKIFTFSTCDNMSRDYRYICYAYVAESTVDGVAGLE